MKILIVEDDSNLSDNLQRVMRSDGIDCDIEHDGRDGLRRAVAGSYDVVVLDIMLPTMNGFKICGALREQDIWTPILMLTAKSGEWDEAESLETGADDYLVKPVSTVVLLAHLRARLDPSVTTGRLLDPCD